MQMTQNN